MDGSPSTDEAAASVYWDIRDIQFHCRVSRSTAWRLVRKAGFPAPVSYGRSVVWPRLEVCEYLELRRRRDHYRVPSTRDRVVETAAPFLTRPVGRRRRPQE